YSHHIQGPGPNQQDQELIATDPGNFIAWPQGGSYPIGRFPQDGIADRMTQGVVDILEAIEIDSDEGDLPPDGRGDLSLEQTKKRSAIPKSRQCVALGKRLN